MSNLVWRLIVLSVPLLCTSLFCNILKRSRVTVSLNRNFFVMTKGKGKQAEVVEPEPVKVEPEITTGKGQFSFADNSKYDGEWKEVNGVKFRDGRGTFTIGPEKYVGNWAMDSMHGFGEYLFSSGAVYKGDFANNQFHGEGSYLFPDGASYSGQWMNNKMHGNGLYKSSDNTVFEGEFFNGMYNTGRSYISLRAIKKS